MNKSKQKCDKKANQSEIPAEQQNRVKSDGTELLLMSNVAEMMVTLN